jgi:hypothetical protein
MALRHLGALLALVAIGCGSSEDDACSPPAIDGVPFTAMGSATLTGRGTLPARVPDGVDLQLMVVDDIGIGLGVLRANLLEPDLTCGKSFTYTVRQLEAGTYTLEFDARVPNSESVEPEYEGRATQSFTIADGQTLSFDSTFE